MSVAIRQTPLRKCKKYYNKTIAQSERNGLEITRQGFELEDQIIWIGLH
jgi:hypothetical protein